MINERGDSNMITEYLYSVREIMTADFIKVKPSETIDGTLKKMIENLKDEVLVVDGEKLVGIFTRSDLARLGKDKDTSFSENVANHIRREVITINPDASAREARDLMLKHKIGRIPVVENDRVIGILTGNNIRDTFYLKVDEIFQLQSNIIDHLHEGVCLCDSEGIVKYWNKNAEILYGVKAEDIIGKHIGVYFPNALTLKVLREGVAIKNKQHEPVKGKSVILSAVPIYNAEKKLIGVVTTDRDITEVVKLSRQLDMEKEKVEILQDAYKKEIAGKYNFVSIMGKSKGIIDAIALSQRVAPTSASVLITGESGTGKEVFAKAIHEASGRTGPFVAINCSAIPENLLESELFGYVEGAFTGAVKKGKMGKFEFANNGTLFLDEIGDMPMGMQAKLLRVLQDGVVYRLGGQKGIPTNTRIIAATNKNLKEHIKEKKFRDDLFYRLAVVQIELPPLRDRKEDIRELINLFIHQVIEKESIKIEDIDENIYRILENYKWEGNIRELKNVVQRMAILSYNGNITSDCIPGYITNNTVVNDENSETNYDLQKIVQEIEKKTIREIMEITKGNKVQAAKMLNIKRTTLYYKLNQYGIE